MSFNEFRLWLFLEAFLGKAHLILFKSSSCLSKPECTGHRRICVLWRPVHRYTYSDPHFWFPLALDWAVTNFKTPGGLKIFPGTRQSLPQLCHGRRNIDVTLPITLCWTDISVIVWAQTFVAFLSIIQSKYDFWLHSPWTMTNFREG